MSLKFEDSCYNYRNRAEGVLMYLDKPIFGVSRVYLLEKKSFNKFVLETNKLPLIKTYESELRRAEREKDKDTLDRIMKSVDMKYAIVEKDTELKIYVDKNISVQRNLGGTIDHGETAKIAFFREINEELGVNYDILIKLGSVEDCIDGYYVLTLSVNAYDYLLNSYMEKYNSNDTEIQTLYHGNNIIAGTNLDLHHIKPRYKGRDFYRKKYLKYKKKYLELKKLLN